MAAMLYLYVPVFSFFSGPFFYLYSSEIIASIGLREVGQCVFNAFTFGNAAIITKITPLGFAGVGWKFWFLWASFNVAATIVAYLACPETKGKSIEEIDIVFGAIKQEVRDAHVDQVLRQEKLSPDVVHTHGHVTA